VLILVMMALSLPLPLSLSSLGAFDTGQVMSQYIGILFLGACCVALGLLISSVSVNQISAYLFCGLALFGLTWIDRLGQVMTLPRWLSSVIAWISFSPHFDSFNKGILDTRDIAFYAVLSALFLFANTQVLIRRKWS
jgi:ABC-2 type transport system permease protein